MQREQYQRLDKFTDEIDGIFRELLNTDKIKKLEKRMQDEMAEIDDNFSLNINTKVEIFDNNREKSIEIMVLGLSCTGGSKPYQFNGVASTAKYLMDGEIKEIPHNYCPYCWEEWDFKIKNRTCPGCGYVLGKEVKLLLDTNVCPSCEKGTVSRTHPKCDKCPFEADENLISWG